MYAEYLSQYLSNDEIIDHANSKDFDHYKALEQMHDDEDDVTDILMNMMAGILQPNSKETTDSVKEKIKNDWIEWRSA